MTRPLLLPIASRLLLMLVVGSCSARTSGQVSFIRTYGLDTVRDYGYCVVQAADDGYYVAGEEVVEDSVQGFRGNAVILRTNSEGDTLWRRNYVMSTELAFMDLVRTADGGLAVAGSIDSGWVGNASGRALIMARLDSTGDIQWLRAVGGDHAQSGSQIKETADGGFIAAGTNSVTGLVGDGAFYLVRTDATGDTLWTKTYAHVDEERAYAIAPTPGGAWVMVGTTSPFSATHMHVKCVDATGDTLWTRTLYAIGEGQARDVEVLPNGHILVGGFSFPSGSYAMSVLAELDENGNLLWYENYHHAGAGQAEWCYSMCRTTTGYALLNMDSDYEAFWLTNIDQAGDSLWSRRYAFEFGTYAYSVEQTSDGGFVMTGITFTTGIQIAMVKTDASGNVITSTHDITSDPAVAVSLFPNPADAMATLRYTVSAAGNFSLLLHDATSRVVRSVLTNVHRAPGSYDERIGLTGLAPGSYTLVLSDAGRTVSTKAIVVR